MLSPTNPSLQKSENPINVLFDDFDLMLKIKNEIKIPNYFTLIIAGFWTFVCFGRSVSRHSITFGF